MRASSRSGRFGAILATTAVITLAACGGTGEVGSDDETNGGDSVTLTLTGLTDQQAAIEALIEAYKEEEPNVTIQANYAPVDQLQTSLRTQLGAGNAPDIHAVWPGQGTAMSVDELTDADLMTELDDPAWLEYVPDNLKPLFGADGKTYMWAPGVSLIGTIYNKQVFEDANLEIPETWSELLAAAETLKAAGIAPFAVGNQTSWVTQLVVYGIAASTAYTEDPEIAEKMLAGETTFATSGWREVFERYKLLLDAGYFNDNPNGTSIEQQINLVASGQAAMAVHVSAVQLQVDAAAEGRAEIGLFPFPANDEPDGLQIPIGVSVGLGISSGSDHQEEARAFLDFIGDPARMVEFSKMAALLPFGAQSEEDIDPLLRPFAPFLEEGKAVPYMDQKWPNAEIQTVHFAMIQELVGGQATIDEVLAKLDEAYQK